MTARTNDALLASGKALALAVQGLCALAGIVVVILFAFLLLLKLGMLGDLVEAQDFPLMQSQPLAYAAILAMLAAMLAGLFAFFGRMRNIIATVGQGDPFVAENARHLNTMAWLLLGVQILALVVGFVRLYLANLASGGGDSLNFTVYDLTGVIMVLVLFILARVFREGAAMRADLEGTV